MKKVYDDAFILHDESADDHKESEKYSDDKNQHQKDRPHSAAVKSVSLCCIKAIFKSYRLSVKSLQTTKQNSIDMGILVRDLAQA